MDHINRKTVAHLLDTFDEVSASVLTVMGYLTNDDGKLDQRAYARLGLTLGESLGHDLVCPNHSCRGQLVVVSVMDVPGASVADSDDLTIISQGWLTCATDARHFGRSITYQSTVASMMEDYSAGARREYQSY